MSTDDVMMAGFSSPGRSGVDARIRSLEVQAATDPADQQTHTALGRARERAGVALFIGIDPGLSGYVVAIFSAGYEVAWAEPIPTLSAGGKTKRKYDLPGLWRIIKRIPAGAHVQVEKQQAYPKQGAVSNFTTGYGFGLVEALLTAAGVPYEVVHPKTWKGKMGLRVKLPAGTKQSARTKANKQKAIETAQRLFPDTDFMPVNKPRARVPSSDYAEAALLALYGRRFDDD